MLPLRLGCGASLLCVIISAARRALAVQRSQRLRFTTEQELDEATKRAITYALHDKMTEMPYPEPMTSFESGLTPEPVRSGSMATQWSVS